MGVEAVDQHLEAEHVGRHVDVQLVAQGAQQLQRVQLGVEDEGDVAVLRHLLQQTAAQGGLAGADLAGEQHEAAVDAQAIEQMGQRLAVPLAHEQVARVGRDREGSLGQAEMLVVHGRFPLLCAHAGFGVGPRRFVVLQSIVAL
ncbi:hypothetical protein D3C80_1544520 [compost metagenome]